jgi:hypothetical protein
MRTGPVWRVLVLLVLSFTTSIATSVTLEAQSPELSKQSGRQFRSRDCGWIDMATATHAIIVSP